MDMFISEEQQQIIIDNYGSISSHSELALLAGCKINQVSYFLRTKSVAYLENHKTKTSESKIEITNYTEPVFSEDEIKMLNDSINQNIDFVDAKTEQINGKKFMVFQSRLNYA